MCQIQLPGTERTIATGRKGELLMKAMGSGFLLSLCSFLLGFIAFRWCNLTSSCWESQPELLGNTSGWSCLVFCSAGSSLPICCRCSLQLGKFSKYLSAPNRPETWEKITALTRWTRTRSPGGIWPGPYKHHDGGNISEEQLRIDGFAEGTRWVQDGPGVEKVWGWTMNVHSTALVFWGGFSCLAPGSSEGCSETQNLMKSITPTSTGCPLLQSSSQGDER